MQFLAGDADNFITNVHIGRSFNMDGGVPHLGADVPRWYGDTIGFWDGDALITWTSNIQGWKVHGNPEFSSKLQTIEIYTPNRDKAGKLRRPEPRRHLLRSGSTRGADPNDPHARAGTAASKPASPTPSSSAFRRSSRSTDARSRWSPGTVIPYKVPNMYDRPWAKIWEEYHEKGMQRPPEKEIISFR